MTDLISRADAMAEFREWVKRANENGETPTWNDAVSLIGSLPSADAEPTVIRSKTLLPTKDFKEWAKRVRDGNPNVIVIPCDAEVVSADAVQGEWQTDTDNRVMRCSVCGTFFNKHTEFFDFDVFAKYCPYCGSRMYKGGDDE
jgi:hypothetical protein